MDSLPEGHSTGRLECSHEMYIDRLIAKNFRNYRFLDMQLSPEANFIVGGNGAGKTNILEVISVLSGIRSFRNTPDSEIILWGESSYYCHATAGDCRSADFEVACSLIDGALRKKVKIDGTGIKKIGDYYGKLLSVFMSPWDIHLIGGAPQLRRRFIDAVISSTDREYLDQLGDFKRILSSRNRLLKRLHAERSSPRAELDAWDGMFARSAVEICRKRRDFMERFSRDFEHAYEMIASDDAPPQLRYNSSLEPDEEESVLSVLRSARERDIIFGSSGMGPQRDDLRFLGGGGRQFRDFASQGQMRTASIALKIAESNYIEKATGERVIILIDDIFSELDQARRRKLLDQLIRGNQVIFTMVNADTVVHAGFRDVKNFFVEGKGIVREQ